MNVNIQKKQQHGYNLGIEWKVHSHQHHLDLENPVKTDAFQRNLYKFWPLGVSIQQGFCLVLIPNAHTFTLQKP